jgi:hypothetical protein
MVYLLKMQRRRQSGFVRLLVSRSWIPVFLGDIEFKVKIASLR